jgi:hypothetical protein
VGGQGDREAGLAEAADHGVVVPEVGRAGGGPRLHQGDRPGVAAEGGPGRVGPLAHGLLPAPLPRRKVDLAEDVVDHAVQQRVLAGHVVVERHGLDPELVGQLAHAQRGDAVLVGQGDRRAQDPLRGQGDARCRARVGLGRHVVSSSNIGG